MKIANRGYYDTIDNGWALLAEGTPIKEEKVSYDAPCKSKQGEGIWVMATCLNSNRRRLTFIEKENISQ